MSSGFNVLLIEDNPADARLFEKLLAKKQDIRFDVTSISSLEKGLAWLEDHTADAVVLDLGLPDSNGLDTFRAVRSKYSELPIIVLSGLDDESVAVQAVQAGAQDYLVKGELTTSYLARAIRYAVERQAAESRIYQLNSDLENRIIDLAAANEELDSLSKSLVLARDQALQASAYKSEFVAKMSHEIRTPLSAVLGTIELLNSTELNQEQDELVQLIRSSADCLLTVVNEVLDYSKLEAGKVELEPIDFSIVTLIETTVDLMIAAARKKGITMMSYIEPSLNVAHGDLIRIRQILLNLIGNAIKFTERGEITVRATRESIDKTSLMVRFTVTDTGEGMSDNAMSKLFQPFVQIGSKKANVPGTGLGLTICKRLVELMGGQIGVRSTVGKGSTFWFSVRLKRAQTLSVTEGLPLRSMVPKKLFGLRVLVCDSNENSRQIIHSYLESSGFNSATAASAGEAMEMLTHASFHDRPIDIIIIDLGDFESAVKLSSDIQGDPTISQTRMIFLTSKRVPGQEVWREGFSSYITKPVRQSSLLSAILDVTVGSLPDTELMVEHSPEDVESLKVFSRSDDLEKKTILVVEDNKFLQTVVTKVLQKLGYSVEVAANGREAVEMNSLRKYDLILMDCQMPELDGYEATRQIRLMEKERAEAEDSPLERTPIVAMTASVRESDRQLCSECGMDDFLNKPATMDQLKRVLSNLVSNSQNSDAR